MATVDGLVRFDGVRFTVFNRGNSPGIRSNRFTALYEAADGAMWAGTEGGGVTEHLYRFAGGQLSMRQLPPAVQGLSNNQFEEEGNGMLWMGTVDRRVGMLGGRHSIVSAPGQGTTVRIVLPGSNGQEQVR